MGRREEGVRQLPGRPGPPHRQRDRSKDAKGPEEWAPPAPDYWCDYAIYWTEIKEQWLLTITYRESEIVMDMLYTYDAPPDVEVELLNSIEARTGEQKTGVSACGCCKEAKAAGGSGWRGARGDERGSRRRWCHRPVPGTAMM